MTRNPSSIYKHNKMCKWAGKEAEKWRNSFIRFTLQLRWFLQRSAKWKTRIRFIINVIIMEIAAHFIRKKGKKMFEFFLSNSSHEWLLKRTFSSMGGRCGVWSLFHHMRSNNYNKVFFYSVYGFFLLTIFLVEIYA